MKLQGWLADKATALASRVLARQWGGAVLMPHTNFSSFWAGLGTRNSHALALSAVYACVRILATDMAKMQLGCFEYLADGTTQYARNHPLNRVFRRPNTWQTGFMWRQAKMVDLALNGNSYDLMVWSENGWLAGLVHLPLSAVAVYQDRATGEMYYRVAGISADLTSAEILHHRGLSVDGVIGLSPIGAARKAAELGMALEAHGLNLFKRGARPGGVVSTEKALGKVGRQNLRAQIEAFVGGENTGGIMVLEEKATFEGLTMTSTDAEFLANRRFQLEEICRIYGVPLHRVAEMVKATYNNAEMVSSDYLNNTLMAWAESIEDTLDTWVLGNNPLYFTQFDVNALLRADQASRYKSYQIGIGSGFLRPNEARRMESRYSPIPLPTYELGDRFYVPSNTVPVELAGKVGQGAGNNSSGGGSNDDKKEGSTTGEEENDE